MASRKKVAAISTEVVSVIIRQIKRQKNAKSGKEEMVEEIIHPWNDVKDLRGWEWIRDASTMVGGEGREIEHATYIARKENEPVFIPGKEAPYDHYNVALFQDNKTGELFEVAERLASERKVKVGDIVALKILGCCSVMDIIKKQGKALEEEDPGGVGPIDEEDES